MTVTIIVVTVERTCLARFPDRLWPRGGEHGISPEEKALPVESSIGDGTYHCHSGERAF